MVLQSIDFNSVNFTHTDLKGTSITFTHRGKPYIATYVDLTFVSSSLITALKNHFLDNVKYGVKKSFSSSSTLVSIQYNDLVVENKNFFYDTDHA